MPSPPVLSRPLHRGSSLSAPPGGARSQRKRRTCTGVSGRGYSPQPRGGPLDRVSSSSEPRLGG